MASSPEAEGGHCFTGDQPPTVAGYTPDADNIVQRLDIRTAVNDDPRAGGDIDKPYPGGATPSLGLPIDG